MNYLQSCLITARLLACDAVNVSSRKVGGLRFLKVGRFTFMVSISATYRPL